MGHANSDIDAMGASMGVYRIAETIGKEVHIVNETNGTSLENFIKDLRESGKYEDVLIGKNEALAKINSDTLLVVVDTDKKIMLKYQNY